MSSKVRQREKEGGDRLAIPVDAGLIRCICPSTEDDGFTIQCEHCLVWQHAYCVRITPTNIPDHFLCDQCSKKRPKLSKRIAISKKKLSKLDSDDNPVKKRKQKPVSRVVSRYAYAIFHEARERWKRDWKYDSQDPFIYDMGAFVTIDADTLLTKGALMNAPVSSQGLFATKSVASGHYLMEVAGDVLLKSEFKFDPLNDFVILGTPLSHIMFFPTLDLCVDTRQFGNKARYIRRSCHPNAELRNMVLPRDDDKTIHLGLFARRLIEKGQEVTIGWGWQRGHVTWKEYMDWHHKSNKDNTNKVIDEEEERKKRTTIQKMLERFEKEFGTCACLNKRRCLIEHLKRQVKKQTDNGHRRRRSKPSVLLLKPRPVMDKNVTEEYVDITSNSPTLGPSKDNPSDDDDLLDIDIVGNETPQASLEVDENQHSDNEDLSSLSSLSSLFATGEEKEQDHTISESSNKVISSPALPYKSIALLPRKKLWARDYLSKHVVDTPISETTIKDEQIVNKEDNKEEEPKAPVKIESNSIPVSSLESQTKVEVLIPHDTIAEEEIVDIIPQATKLDKDEPKEDIPSTTDAPIESDNESELSDASTVLLEDICT
ncbi:hypothetical protein G6F16_011139 [Rhizopus arrhizus]|nr:hypothetical protein G6F22_011204 [Rhizopus arrhizus]KAG0782409.1 hypothetical protein G6F21_011127 [Rhizopus arrhizus]KAG0822768.1 hypothetical protein G6F19_011185 [Rhizopus arrhizus]KAG0853850.1 hypothetical protein G6F17_006866 [Rhizopus arrhizus]KAG0864288.1 hypothetical protein G6F16_011139 [Rhizopus arrhizus]